MGVSRTPFGHVAVYAISRKSIQFRSSKPICLFSKECTIKGTQNHGKPLTITLNVTNTGTMTNNLVYMFVYGELTSMALADIAPGESGDLTFGYTPDAAGTKALAFSLYESGTPTLYTKNITINSMPSADLDVSYRILNITNEEERIITADRYSIIVDVTNNGTTAYDEDFSVRLYRINNGETNVGTELLSLSQPLYLPAGESTSLQFDFDHDLIDGWKYFCYLYYYSEGSTVGKGTKWYYLNLTGDTPGPDFILGDVDRDGQVGVSDITALVDYILSREGDIDLNGADVTQDGNIEIADVTALIDLVLVGS